MTPHRSNIHETAPSAARLPPPFANDERTSPAVRWRLSVRHSTMTATPPGPYPSYTASSYETPSSSPVPFLIARVMLSEGMFASFAASIAARRRALPLGSPPPMRAETVISLMSFVKSLPFAAPCASFLRLILVQRLWPDMALLGVPFSAGGSTPFRSRSSFSGAHQGRLGHSAG